MTTEVRPTRISFLAPRGSDGLVVCVGIEPRSVADAFGTVDLVVRVVSQE